MSETTSRQPDRKVYAFSFKSKPKNNSIAVDLPDDDTAIALAVRMALRTAATVVVTDDRGNRICAISGSVAGDPVIIETVRQLGEELDRDSRTTKH